MRNIFFFFLNKVSLLLFGNNVNFLIGVSATWFIQLMSCIIW